MDTKSLIGAIVAAFVILLVAGFLVRGVWLGNNTKALGIDYYEIQRS